MRKLRIFLVELVLVGLLVAWLFEKYRDLLEPVIPWICLAILWHLTWEIILENEPVKSRVRRACGRWPRMSWIIAFLVGGLISIGYLYFVNIGLKRLAAAEHVEPMPENALHRIPPAPPPSASPPAPLSRPTPVPAKPVRISVALPEVKLRFVYPKGPALVIENISDSIAREIKWAVALWNLDLPDRNDPLPIPVRTFDWIRPHDESGPQDLFGSPQVVPLLKQGNRLFGSASVTCPDCARGRTYIVYMVWGENGWFLQVENDKSGRFLVPINLTKETREAFFKQLESMSPETSRIQISGLNGIGAH